MKEKLSNELVCMPSEIPVNRVLGLQAFAMTAFPTVKSSVMYADDPRRRKFAVHYETLPLSRRKELNEDITFYHEEVDQDVFLSYRVMKPHPRMWRIGARIVQFSRQFGVEPIAQELRYAFEWGKGDETVAGVKRLREFDFMKPGLRGTGFDSTASVDPSGGFTIDYSEAEHIVSMTDRAIVSDDVDILETHMVNIIERKKDS